MARAFLFGDDIDIDRLAPGHAMKLAPAAMARFCLESLDPAFATAVRPGDIVVAGANFGMGSAREQADVTRRIRERAALPLIVDADNGFGSALNVARTVRLIEAAGASAIQLEDQTFPKRCGHLSGKSVIPAADMVGKLHAALDARRSDDTLIVARTDAISVLGFDAALDRAEAFVQAGADVIFV